MDRVRVPGAGAATLTRVLIVDDQPLVRAGLRVILEHADGLEVVGEASDGAEAIALVARRAPDVVLMDIRMPVLDGLQASRRILSGDRAAVAVIVLTTFDADENVYAALRAGASGFLVKDTPEEQLIESIRIVAAGDAIISPAVTKRLIERFAQGPGPRAAAAGMPDAVGELTVREHEVFIEVARGRSNQEIASSLVVSLHTVKTHVARLLMKLHLRDRVQVVVFAYETGVIARGDEQPAAEIARESDDGMALGA
jgi:DNA-binding NarL/FixJ family response regulator